MPILGPTIASPTNPLEKPDIALQVAGKTVFAMYPSGKRTCFSHPTDDGVTIARLRADLAQSKAELEKVNGQLLRANAKLSELTMPRPNPGMECWNLDTGEAFQWTSVEELERLRSELAEAHSTIAKQAAELKFMVVMNEEQIHIKLRHIDGYNDLKRELAVEKDMRKQAERRAEALAMCNSSSLAQNVVGLANSLASGRNPQTLVSGSLRTCAEPQTVSDVGWHVEDHRASNAVAAERQRICTTLDAAAARLRKYAKSYPLFDFIPWRKAKQAYAASEAYRLAAKVVCNPVPNGSDELLGVFNSPKQS